jgi:hypothetical protein
MPRESKRLITKPLMVLSEAWITSPLALGPVPALVPLSCILSLALLPTSKVLELAPRWL